MKIFLVISFALLSSLTHASDCSDRFLNKDIFQSWIEKMSPFERKLAANRVALEYSSSRVGRALRSNEAQVLNLANDTEIKNFLLELPNSANSNRVRNRKATLVQLQNETLSEVRDLYEASSFHISAKLSAKGISQLQLSGDELPFDFFVILRLLGDGNASMDIIKYRP
jgi:hypothetical protein